MARILIAEDEILISMALCMLLEDEGHEVESATDGRKALELARQAPPALIITDYMMPVMDGLALIAAIRADAALRHVPIILSSAIAEDHIREKTTAYDAYVAKPAQDLVLLGTVNRLLGREG